MPENFPKIFGKNQNESLDIDISKRLFSKLTQEVIYQVYISQALFKNNEYCFLKINEYLKNKSLAEMTLEEVALGFVRVANEAMCRPIRNLTEVNFRKNILSFK